MRRPDWMDTVDQRILDKLDHLDEGATAAALADALHYRPDYITDRCHPLDAHGLVQPLGHDDPSDRLRDPGVAFVDEELTPEVFETLRRVR